VKVASAGNQTREAMRSLILVVAMLGVQVALLRISSPLIAVGSLVAAVVLAILRGVRRRRIAGAVRGILFLLVPVLLFRILALGLAPATFLSWVTYAARLLAAVVAALLLLHEVGPSGIRRALSLLLAAFPRRVAEPIGTITGTALFLIPGILIRVAAVRGAARVRFASDGATGRAGPAFLRRQARIYRAVLVGLLSVPQGRAEAMVVRGAVGSSHTGIATGSGSRSAPRKESSP